MCENWFIIVFFFIFIFGMRYGYRSFQEINRIRGQMSIRAVPTAYRERMLSTENSDIAKDVYFTVIILSYLL